MSDPETDRPCEPASPPGRARRLPLLVAAGLLLATLGVGLVPRHSAPAAPATPAARAQTGAPPAPTTAAGPVSLALRLDRHALLAGGDGQLRVELELRGKAGEAQRLPGGHGVPTDFVVILDRSGSMSGAPLQLARRAVETLIARLAPDDRLALVSYANQARIDLPLEGGTAGARRHSALAGIAAAGGTNLSSGLDLAHHVVATASRAGRVARVVLLSDGHANQGDPSLEGLRARAQRARAHEYIVSAIGLGSGFDETVMSTIADAGTGNFYYLPDASRIAAVLDDELLSARETVASALRVEFEPGAGVELLDAGGYPLERGEGRVAFHPGALFAGQERRVFLTLRAPTVPAAELALGRLSVAFTDAGGARHSAVAALPALAVVRQEHDYYASFDDVVYRRGSAEVVGALKRRVAGQLKAGDAAAASADVEATLDTLKQQNLRALGYAMTSEVEALEDLEERMSAPGSERPGARNRLGKQLLEEGRDASRAGAKR